MRDRRLAAPSPAVALVSTVALLATAGCGAGDRADAFAVRDSAGIRIAESAAPAWPEGGGWRVAPEPAVRIGALEGDEAYQLFRVSQALRLADGRIVVVNSGVPDIRYYDADGRHLKTVGREGSGPGEFREISRAYRLTGDSLLVVGFDRVSVFDAAGEFVRSRPSPVPLITGRFGDGSFLLTGFAAGVDPYRLGHVRDSTALIRLDRDGSSRDTIAIVPGKERYRAEYANGISAMDAPFGRPRSIAIHGTHIYTGDGADFTITVLDPLGRHIASYRRSHTPRPVTSDDIARLEERLRGIYDSGARRPWINRVLREWSYPDRWPAYDRILAGTDGTLWVRHDSEAGPFAADSDRPAAWSVFDADGRWLGVVETPTGLDVSEFGADYVLGVARDELDIEYLELYMLDKTTLR